MYDTTMSQRYKYNFSFVELALVLLIMCLVVSSLFVGNALMEQAKLRSLIAEVSEVRSRVADFEMLYDYKPGDFPYASEFWGIDSCGGRTYGANGDGDGFISYKKSNIVPNRHDAVIESFVAWCHMAMANLRPPVEVLIDDQNLPVADVNLPGTSMGGVLHFIGGSANVFNFETDVNAIVLGNPNTNMSVPNSLLTPRQARSIDLKMSNGNPLDGDVRAASGADAAHPCVINGTYNKQHYDEKLCIMAFALPSKQNETDNTVTIGLRVD